MKIKKWSLKFPFSSKIKGSIMSIYQFIKNILFLIQNRVSRSIRMQLMATFIVCLLSGMLVTSMADNYLSRVHKDFTMSYVSGVEEIDYHARKIVDEISNYYEGYVESLKNSKREEGDTGPFSDETAVEDVEINSIEEQDEASRKYESEILPENQEEMIIEGEISSSSSSPMEENSSSIQGIIEKYTMEFYDFIDNLINSRSGEVKTLIVDLDGNVLYKSDNAVETKVDIYNVIKKATSTENYFEKIDGRNELIRFYPISIEESLSYVIVSGVPRGERVYYEGDTGFIPLILGTATFILMFYFATQQKMKNLEEISNGLIEISKGNLDYRISWKSEDELGSLAYNINFMAEELERKIEAERRADALKNELITNVSHDLRTPLTSIMGYLSLLKYKKYGTEEEAHQYLDIAYGKSEKLKILIQDLFEYTKLSNAGAKLKIEPIHLNELIEQLTEEMIPILEEKNLSFQKDLEKDLPVIMLDAPKIVRVFENLISNGVRHSSPNENIRVVTSLEEDFLTIAVENKGDPIAQEDLDRIFDRFYKVEKSRSSSSGGAGLGLAISKNIIELHGGRIWAESEGDLVSFKIRFPKDIGKKEL